MTKRRHIVANDLVKYPVADDINEMLDRLDFKEMQSQVPDWKLFTRRDEDNEFAAIYRNREFLVDGLYSTIDVPQRDMESIGRYIFNERWISRKIRNGSLLPLAVLGVPFSWFGILIYDIKNDVKILDRLENYARSIYPALNGNEHLMYPVILAAGMGASMGGVFAASNLLNRYYSSKLSEEAEGYLYGKAAEGRLRREFIFEKIKSGEMKKEDFMRLTRYEI
ncbi:MAG: hypothetical protein QMD85_03070 [Candidatus Aenigmarchaeota archaeon]|nr:hypothetical protein [Candidatus Aenigmarchaeota archaeon]MDI6722513.1 hypothetical protein [Candidatus Aenigmarchaeota archaeon]